MTVTHVLPTTPTDFPHNSPHSHSHGTDSFPSFTNVGRSMLLPSPQSEKTVLSTSGGSSSSRDVFELSPSAGKGRDLPRLTPTIGCGIGTGGVGVGPTIEVDPPSTHGMNRPGFQSIGSAVDLGDVPGPSKSPTSTSTSTSTSSTNDLSSAASTSQSSSSHTASTDPPSTSRKHRATHALPLHGRVRDRSKSRTHMPYSRSAGELTAPTGWEDVRGMSSTSRRGQRRASDQDHEEELEGTDVEHYGPLDNSARFYFAHPYSKSASTSPDRPRRTFFSAEPISGHTSTRLADPPSSTTPSSARTVPFAPLGNLLARRNFALPDRTNERIQDAISPNSGHIELNVRPATPSEIMEEAAASVAASDNPSMPSNGRLVVLTPTTQEWRELGLDNLHDLGGEGSVSESESDPGRKVSEEERRSSWGSTAERQREGSLGLKIEGRPEGSSASPVGTQTVVDDTPEPPSRDGSRSAPPMLEDSELWSRLLSLKQEQNDGSALDTTARSRPPSPKPLGHNSSRSESVIGTTINPASLSRSQSMREPIEARQEKARERLFRLVGEEVEKHGLDAPSGSWGVRQIGNGLGLGEVPALRVDDGPPRLGRSSSAHPVVRSPESPQENRTESLLPAPIPQRLGSNLPAAPSPLSALATSNSPDSSDASSHPRSRKPTRHYSRSPSINLSQEGTSSSADVEPITSRRRQSQRLSLLAGRTLQPFAFPSVLPPSAPSNYKKHPSQGLSSFSPFFAPSTPYDSGGMSPKKGVPPSAFPFKTPVLLGNGGRSDSTISFAPSIAAPSECATPQGETVGGIGGRGIEDYVIESEAGKGAYGLVKRAHQKGPDGQPRGEEVIIKYIIKSRILADCWKKHKQLGPIPIEIHVMDQLRNIRYHPPTHPHPWDPARAQTPQPAKNDTSKDTLSMPIVDGDDASESDNGAWQPRLSLEALKGRGHPNICKMLDFFEDKEFYYLVMPRFGLGLDLFDRVESAPDGLPPFEIRSLLGQLSDALAFLHANGIVHRDIKDENVILDGQGRAQLIDFGSAAHWRPTRKWDTFSGTLDYASPEILRGEMYGGKEQDVWALGVVGYVLICGETPFLSADEAQAGLAADSRAYAALAERCEGDHFFDDGLEADGGGRMGDAMDFVKRCLEMQPADRPPADALMRHRFLVGMGGWTGHRRWLNAQQD